MVWLCETLKAKSNFSTFNGSVSIVLAAVITIAIDI